MKVVTCTKYGGPEVLKIKHMETPSIKDDEILLEIHASAVSVSDTVVRKLEAPGDPGPVKKKAMEIGMRLALGVKSPRNPILGMVSSGKIIACGKKVSLFKVGDEVLSFSGSKMGGYAEYKVIPESDAGVGALILKPFNLSYAETAAIAYGGVLALHFLQPRKISSQDEVIIYGASGSIGTTGIQLAKSRGARVTAMCSASNFELVSSLGADQVIDYRDPNASRLLGQYDHIFDAVGKKKNSKSKDDLIKHLKQGGRMISVDDSLLKQQQSYLEDLKLLAEEQLIVPVIDKTFEIDQIVEAHKYVDLGHKRGNVIIKIR